MKKLAKRKATKKTSVKKVSAKKKVTKQKISKKNPSIRKKSESGRDWIRKYESLKIRELNELADKIQKEKEKDYPINGYPRWRALEDANYQLKKRNN
jgi:hypothetical protein